MVAAQEAEPVEFSAAAGARHGKVVGLPRPRQHHTRLHGDAAAAAAAAAAASEVAGRCQGIRGLPAHSGQRVLAVLAALVARAGAFAWRTICKGNVSTGPRARGGGGGKCSGSPRVLAPEERELHPSPARLPAHSIGPA